MQQFRLPDGSIHQFPDYMSREEIDETLDREWRRRHADNYNRLKKDPVFLGLSRVDRQEKFNEWAGLWPGWKGMSGEEHVGWRQGLVEAEGAAPRDSDAPKMVDDWIDRAHETPDWTPGFVGPFVEGSRELAKGLAGGLPEAAGMVMEAPAAVINTVADAASLGWNKTLHEALLADAKRRMSPDEYAKYAAELEAQRRQHEDRTQPWREAIETDIEAARHMAGQAELGGAQAVAAGRDMVGPPVVGDIRDIDSPTAFAQWAGRGLGGQVPIMGGIVAAGAIGGAPGAMGAGMALETGSIMEDMRETFGEVDHEKAMLGGVIAGSLEAIAPMKVLRRFGAEELAGKLAKTIGKRAINALKTGGTEALTEFLQTGVETVTSDWMALERDEIAKIKLATPEGRRETLWEALNAAALGALVGGGTGMMGSGHDSTAGGQADGDRQANVPGRDGEASSPAPLPSPIAPPAVDPLQGVSGDQFDRLTNRRARIQALPVDWPMSVRELVADGKMTISDAAAFVVETGTSQPTDHTDNIADPSRVIAEASQGSISSQGAGGVESGPSLSVPPGESPVVPSTPPPAAPAGGGLLGLGYTLDDLVRDNGGIKPYPDGYLNEEMYGDKGSGGIPLRYRGREGDGLMLDEMLEMAQRDGLMPNEAGVSELIEALQDTRATTTTESAFARHEREQGREPPEVAAEARRVAAKARRAEARAEREMDAAAPFQVRGASRFNAEAQSGRGAEASQPVFFSRLKRTIEGNSQKKWQPAQLLAWVKKQPGVKAEELEWTGLEEWLEAQGPKVSRDDVVAYLEGNGVAVEEVVRSDSGRYPYKTAEDWTAAIDRAEKADDWEEAERLNSLWEEQEVGETPDGDTRYGAYTLGGGENYRELLLTLPGKRGVAQHHVKEIGDPTSGVRYTVEASTGGSVGLYDTRQEAETAARKADEKYQDTTFLTRDNYTTGHWDEPNVLAHVRFNERTDADGKRVLFIEEIQSDWHQAGRKRGYNRPVAQYQAFYEGDNGQAVTVAWGESPAAAIAQAGVNGWTEQPGVELQTRRQEYKGTGIPDAPFKGNAWVELGLKRMVRWAAENGFDKVAWTTGEQQADRYDLSKQISQIETQKINDEYSIWAWDHNNRTVMKKQVPADKIEDHVGKELAAKILEYHKENPSNWSENPRGNFSGLDLKVGGEGMKGFYDKALGKIAQKLYKKHGVRVGAVDLGGQAGAKGMAYRVQAPDGATVETYRSREAAERNLFEIAIIYGYMPGELTVHAGADVVRNNLVNGFEIPESLKTEALGGQPLFKVDKARPSEPKRPSLHPGRKPAAVEQPPGDLLDNIGRAFPGATVEARAYGAEVFIPGFDPVRVARVQSIQPTKDGLAAWGLTPTLYREMTNANEKWAIAGSYGTINERGLIRLVEGIADDKTLFHESFHWAFANILSPADKKLLLEAYRGEKLDPGTRQGREKIEELIAEGYALNTAAHRDLWKKIREWVEATLSALGVIEWQPEHTFRELRTGKLAAEAGRKRGEHPARARAASQKGAVDKARGKAPYLKGEQRVSGAAGEDRGARRPRATAQRETVSPHAGDVSRVGEAAAAYGEQLDLLYGDEDSEAKELAGQALDELKKTEEQLGLPIGEGEGVSATFAKRGGLALVGRTAKSPQELAVLAQVLRDNRIETLRFFFVDDEGKILAQTATSSRLPNASGMTPTGWDQSAWLNKLKGQMKRLGATGYYMVHNHPSGSPDPSSNDRGITYNISEKMEGFKGHVVIDDVQAAVISVEGPGQVAVEMVYIKPGERAEAPPVSINQGRLFFEKNISGPDELMNIATGMRDLPAKDRVAVIFTNGKLETLWLTEFRADALNMNTFRDLMVGYRRSLGAGRAFLVARELTEEQRIQADGLIRLGTFTDLVETEKPYPQRAGNRGVRTAFDYEGGRKIGAMKTRRVSETEKRYGRGRKAAVKLQIKDTQSVAEDMKQAEDAALEDSFVKDRMRAFFGARDVAFQKASNEAKAVQDRLKKIAKDVWPRVIREMGVATKRPPWARGSAAKLGKQLDRAVHLAVDMRRDPEARATYWDKLSKDQQRQVEMAEAIEKIPGLREIADYVEWASHEAGLEALDKSVISNVLEHYVFRRWKPKKAKGIGGGGAQFQLKSGHRLKRTYETILEGWAEGHELALEGASSNLEALKREIAVTIESKRLHDELMRTQVSADAEGKGPTWFSTKQWSDVDVPRLGLGMLGGSWRRDAGSYHEIEYPGFAKWTPTGKIMAGRELATELRSRNMRAGDVEYVVRREGTTRALPGGVHKSRQAAEDFKRNHSDRMELEVVERAELLERKKMYAPAELAQALNRVFGRSKLYVVPGVRVLTRANAFLKKVLLMTGFFHHQAFARSYWLGVSGKKRGEWGLRKAYKTGLKAVEKFGPEIEMLVRNGLTLGRMQDWEDVMAPPDGRLMRALKKNGASGAVIEKAGAFMEWQTNALFKKFGAGLKAQSALIELRNRMKHHPDMDPDEAARQVARLINADFGGLHLERMYRDPTSQHIFRLFALAPDWTESNIQTLINMVRKGGEHERKLYMQFWAGILSRFFGATALLSLALSFGDDDDAWEKLKKAWGEDGEWKKLHWLQLDVTRIRDWMDKDNDGTRKYFSLLGHFGDPVKFVLRPATSAHHKGSVIYKMLQEFLTGSDWKGHGFTTMSELLGIDDKGYTVAGEPKGGKAKGKLTRPGGRKKPISVVPSSLGKDWQLPSYLSHQVLSALPIQAQAALGFALGQADGWDTVMQMVGAHAHATYKPEVRERMDKVAETAREGRYIKAYGTQKEWSEFRSKHTDLLRMERERERRAKEIRKLRKQIVAAEKRDDDKDKIKRLEQRIKEQEERFMKRWKVVMK